MVNKMTSFVGIDYGTAMIKGALLETESAAPGVINLGQDPQIDSDFLPSAVQVLVVKGKPYFVGWTAFRRRRKSGAGVACGFRDRLLAPRSSLMVEGQTVSGLKIHYMLWTSLGRRMKSAVPQPHELCVAVPDAWSAPRWLLPAAIQKANLRPARFAREWCAVLALEPTQPSDLLLMISAGYSGTSCTVVQMTDGEWRAIHTQTSVEVSGRRVRELLANQVANEVISATRRDPREDPQVDPLLNDAIEELCLALAYEDQAPLQLEVYGATFSRPFTRVELAETAAALRRELDQLIDQTLASADCPGTGCSIVTWGELTHLLPLAAWLDSFTPSQDPVRLLGLEAVACGAAQLSASLQIGGWLPTSWVHQETGERSNVAAESENAAAWIPLWESLPADIVSVSSPDAPTLVLISEDGQEERRQLHTHRLRLGRDPRSEWVFDSELHSGVSSAHAVIVRDGSHYLLKDLSSSNGTFVNGREVPQHLLQHLDVIRLGTDGPRLRFEWPRSADDSTANAEAQPGEP